jgi:DNA-binding Xre family transcriptional regulator
VAGLNSIVWQNIDRLLAARGIGQAGLKQIVRRNKNTYTNWFHEPRPILKIDDLDDLAAALEVTPADLVSPSLGAHGKADRIELPFAPNSLKAAVEIESVHGGFVLLRPSNRTLRPETDGTSLEPPPTT